MASSYSLICLCMIFQSQIAVLRKHKDVLDARDLGFVRAREHWYHPIHRKSRPLLHVGAAEEENSQASILLLLICTYFIASGVMHFSSRHPRDRISH